MSEAKKNPENHAKTPGEIVVAALYKFASWPEYESHRTPLQELCERLHVVGTLLLAHEGINGTIAGSRNGIDVILNHLKKIPALEGLEHKESWAADQPYIRMKVRLKREIVTMGEPDIDPDKSGGTYVEPENWNALISDPDVIVIDTRNDYEVAIGSFEGALDPATSSFRQFPKWTQNDLPDATDKKIAMFCTGGIRCEKATAYLKERGYRDVFHLKGGILKYLEKVAPEESLWRGECFVFDRRVSVGHGLEPGSYKLCAICRQPVLQDNGHGGGYIQEACPTCAKSAPESTRTRAMERQKQIEIATKRGATHLGPQHPKT